MKVHTRPLQWDDQFSTEIGSDRSRDSTKQIASENIYNKKYTQRWCIFISLWHFVQMCIAIAYHSCIGGRGTGGGLRMGEGVVDTQAGQINR